MQRGLCAHVPCAFTVPANIRLTVQTNAFWNRLSRGRLTSVASRENSEYHTNGHVYLTGNVTAGDCSYYIENPRPKEEHLYAFRIEDIQTRYTYSNILPYVEVTGEWNYNCTMDFILLTSNIHFLKIEIQSMWGGGGEEAPILKYRSFYLLDKRILKGKKKSSLLDKTSESGDKYRIRRVLNFNGDESSLIAWRIIPTGS